MECTYRVPNYVLSILRKLEDSGYEAFLVGGCVRDFLLSKRPKDYDVATSAKPSEVKVLFSHTVDIGEKFGTVAVIAGGKTVEVTTYRTDGEYTDGRHPNSVQPASTLREDCLRRDFTINAFGYHPQGGLIDYFGGLGDLENKLIRTVGNPEKRFGEDALRILRGYRFSAQLGFVIEEKTKEAAISLKENLQMVSAERIREELFKILNSDRPETIYTLLTDGILPYQANSQTLSILSRRLRLGKFYLSLKRESRARFLADMRLPKNTIKWLTELERISQCQYERSHLWAKKLLSQFSSETLLDYGAMVDKRLCQYLRSALASGEPYTISGLAINGDDIKALGIPHGVEIGKMLKELLDHCIAFPEDNNRETLTKIILMKPC